MELKISPLKDLDGSHSWPKSLPNFQKKKKKSYFIFNVTKDFFGSHAISYWGNFG